MPYNEKIADRIREALADAGKVEERTMFRGMCFIVRGKLSVWVGGDEMMCRIDPEKFEAALERPGCRPMIHGESSMKGFVYVNEDGMKTKKDFDFWIGLVLEFSKKAKATRKPGQVRKKK